MTPPAGVPAVAIAGVAKHYGDVRAVDDVSLEVPSGAFFSLLGASGSGKSTLLRLIAGLEFPDHGRILIAGQDVTRVPAYLRPVNTVFQSYALFPHLSVFDNVAYGLRREGLARPEIEQRVSETLRMVAMGDFARRRPNELSGGQQQRVAICRAIVKRPLLLLLDEPLAALDRRLREHTRFELKSLQDRLGITFLMVTHDQEEAMSMSDRIAIMLDGHIEQLGDPETVYEHPASAFVAGFIGRNNFWSGVATEHGARADDGTEFVASRPEEDVPNGQGALAAVRPESINLSVERPNDTNNAFQGTVAGVSHFGDVLQYVVHTADRDVLVLTPRANASRLYAGDSVWARWSADDVYLFSSRQADIVLAEADEVSDE